MRISASGTPCGAEPGECRSDVTEFWEELAAVLTDGGIEACVGVSGGG